MANIYTGINDIGNNALASIVVIDIVMHFSLGIRMSLVRDYKVNYIIKSIKVSLPRPRPQGALSYDRESNYRRRN